MPAIARRNCPAQQPRARSDGYAGIAGLVFFNGASSDKERSDALARKIGPTGCVDGTASAADCAAAIDATESHDRERVWGTVSIAVAAGAAAGTIGYVLWASTRDSRTSVRASALVDGSKRGVLLTGSF